MYEYCQDSAFSELDKFVVIMFCIHTHDQYAQQLPLLMLIVCSALCMHSRCTTCGMSHMLKEKIQKKKKIRYKNQKFCVSAGSEAGLLQSRPAAGPPFQQCAHGHGTEPVHQGLQEPEQRQVCPTGQGTHAAPHVCYMSVACHVQTIHVCA